jgi:hypothetical protein
MVVCPSRAVPVSGRPNSSQDVYVAVTTPTRTGGLTSLIVVVSVDRAPVGLKVRSVVVILKTINPGALEALRVVRDERVSGGMMLVSRTKLERLLYSDRFSDLSDSSELPSSRLRSVHDNWFEL